jgi:hypothetical protein
VAGLWRWKPVPVAECHLSPSWEDIDGPKSEREENCGASQQPENCSDWHHLDNYGDSRSAKVTLAIRRFARPLQYDAFRVTVSRHQHSHSLSLHSGFRKPATELPDADFRILCTCQSRDKGLSHFCTMAADSKYKPSR